jgi:hypothetical protein
MEAQTLRIVEGDTGESIDLYLIGEGDPPRMTAHVDVNYRLSDETQEALRWYLEDYPSFPQSPATGIARRIGN